MAAPQSLLLAAVLLTGAALPADPVAAAGPGPDPNEELAHIAAAYGALGAYSLEVAFALYGDATTSVPFETAEASIERRGALLRSRLAGVETVVGEEILVVADHDSRVLMIDRRPAAAGGPAPTLELDPAAFDVAALLGEEPGALLEYPAKLRVEESARRRTLSIDYPRGEHRRVELVYDSRSYHLDLAVLFFRHSIVLEERADAAAPRIEIRYGNLDTRPAFTAETFSPDRFFTRGPGGEIEPALRFRGYRVIQHLTPRDNEARGEPR